MKRVNLSLMMYAADSDGLYPPQAQWMDDIYPYSKNEVILHSLAVLPTKRSNGPSKTDPYGIAFRKSLAFVDCDKIALPEQIAVIFDSTDLSRNASGELNLLPNPPRHKGDKGPYNLISFVDGHVKAVPKIEVIVR